MQGKAALAELKEIVGSEYFPTDNSKALQQLRNSNFAVATDALVRGFVDQLIFGFLTKEDTLFNKSQVVAAVNAASEMYPAIAEERIRKQLNKVIRDVPDDLFPLTVWLVAYTNQGWNVLESAARDKVINFIGLASLDDILNVLGPLSEIPSLNETLKSRVDALDFDELVRVVDLPDLKELVKERALYFLSEVRSWDRANIVFSKAILPLFDILTAEEISHIIRMHTENGADLPGAHGFGLFIQKVRESTIFDEPTLNQLLMDNGSSYLVPQAERA